MPKKYVKHEGILILGATGEDVYAKLDKKRLTITDAAQQEPLHIVTLHAAEVRIPNAAASRTPKHPPCPCLSVLADRTCGTTQFERFEESLEILPSEEDEPIELACKSLDDADAWEEALEKNLKYAKKHKDKDDDYEEPDTPRSTSADELAEIPASPKKMMKKAGGPAKGGRNRERRKSQAHIEAETIFKSASQDAIAMVDDIETAEEIKNLQEEEMIEAQTELEEFVETLEEKKEEIQDELREKALEEEEELSTQLEDANEALETAQEELQLMEEELAEEREGFEEKEAELDDLTEENEGLRTAGGEELDSEDEELLEAIDEAEEEVVAEIQEEKESEEEELRSRLMDAAGEKVAEQEQEMLRLQTHAEECEQKADEQEEQKNDAVESLKQLQEDLDQAAAGALSADTENGVAADTTRQIEDIKAKADEEVEELESEGEAAVEAAESEQEDMEEQIDAAQKKIKDLQEATEKMRQARRSHQEEEEEAVQEQREILDGKKRDLEKSKRDAERETKAAVNEARDKTVAEEERRINQETAEDKRRSKAEHDREMEKLQAGGESRQSEGLQKIQEQQRAARKRKAAHDAASVEARRGLAELKRDIETLREATKNHHRKVERARSGGGLAGRQKEVDSDIAEIKEEVESIRRETAEKNDEIRELEQQLMDSRQSRQLAEDAATQAEQELSRAQQETKTKLSELKQELELEDDDTLSALDMEDVQEQLDAQERFKRKVQSAKAQLDSIKQAIAEADTLESIRSEEKRLKAETARSRAAASDKEEEAKDQQREVDRTKQSLQLLQESRASRPAAPDIEQLNADEADARTERDEAEARKRDVQEKKQQAMARRREAEQKLAQTTTELAAKKHETLKQREGTSVDMSRRKQAADARIERAQAALSQLRVSRANAAASPKPPSPGLDTAALSSALQQLQLQQLLQQQQQQPPPQQPPPQQQPPLQPLQQPWSLSVVTQALSPVAPAHASPTKAELHDRHRAALDAQKQAERAARETERQMQQLYGGTHATTARAASPAMAAAVQHHSGWAWAPHEDEPPVSMSRQVRFHQS
jgi:hypothetical protein